MAGLDTTSQRKLVQRCGAKPARNKGDRIVDAQNSNLDWCSSMQVVFAASCVPAESLQMTDDPALA